MTLWSSAGLYVLGSDYRGEYWYLLPVFGEMLWNGKEGETSVKMKEEEKESLEISPCVYLQSTEEEPSTSRIARRSALTEQKSGTGFVTCGGRRIANSGQNRLDAGKSTPKEGARKESDCHTGLLCSESSDQPLCDDQQEPTRPGYCGIFLEISWRSWSVLVIPRAPWRLSP